MKLNLSDCTLNDKGKEDFLAKINNFHDVFSLRDEIGTWPFIEVHLELKDETPFFVRPYPMHKEQKKINHAFPLVRDCIEQLGQKCCHYFSTIDLRYISYLEICSFISKILWNYTILWFTYIPFPSNGYGYEHESTDLATIHRSCIPR